MIVAYYRKINEVGEDEVSYSYSLTFVRKLLRLRPEVKTYVLSPDGSWYHKYIGKYPTDAERIEIMEVIEMIRQREKYAFYMGILFI